MKSSTLIECLVVAFLVLLFADSAVYRLTVEHRPVTTLQFVIVGLLNLAFATGLLWWVLRRRREGGPFFRFERSQLRQKETWFGWLAVLAHVVAKLPYLDLTARNDSSIYFLMTLRASHKFDLSVGSLMNTFRFAQHPSQAWAIFMTTGQLMFPTNRVVANIQSLMLSVLGVYCFWLLLKKLFPTLTPLVRLLGTLAYAFNPLFFGVGLMPNTDFALAVLMVVVLTCFVYGRWIAFSFAGLCLCFTKEPGTMSYGLLVPLLFLLYVVPAAKSPRQVLFGLRELLQFPRQSEDVPTSGWRPLTRTLGIVLLAALPVVVFLAVQRSVPAGRWATSAMTWNDRGFQCFGLRTSMFRTVLSQVFLMNFSWLPTLAILTYLAKRQIWGIGENRPSRPAERAILRAVAFVFVAFVALHCLYCNHLNTRYVAGQIPLFLLLAVFAIQELVRGERLRLALLAGFVGLCVAQTWYSLDPVMNRVWWTFNIGKRKLVNIGRTRGDSRGLMGDGMAYNAQHASIERLFQQVTAKQLGGQPQMAVFLGANGTRKPYFAPSWSHVDPTTKRLTSGPNATGRIPTISVDDIKVKPLPARAVYVAMPWFESPRKSLEKLSQFYAVGEAIRVSYGSYYRDTYQLNVKK